MRLRLHKRGYIEVGQEDTGQKDRVGLQEGIVLLVGERFGTVLILYPRPHNQVEKVW